MENIREIKTLHRLMPNMAAIWNTMANNWSMLSRLLAVVPRASVLYAWPRFLLAEFNSRRDSYTRQLPVQDSSTSQSVFWSGFV